MASLTGMDETPANRPCREAAQLLDEVDGLIRARRVAESYRLLGPALSEIQAEAEAAGTGPELTQAVREHPVFSACLQDPYTHRAFAKPRGYAGDAVMLDFVYGGVPPAGTSEAGATVFSVTTRGPMGLSVLYRRSLLKAYIDDVVATTPGFRILSVASGHCRELEGSLLLEGEFSGDFLALDQDASCCDRVAADYPHPSVRSEPCTVRALIGGAAAAHGSFDLVYSAGLYDYLPDSVAAKLTAVLIQCLRPGGRLLIGNFLPTSSGRGYMSQFMDWHLQYRCESELVAMFGDLSGARVRTAADPHGNVVYAEYKAGPRYSGSASGIAEPGSGPVRSRS